MKALQHQYGDKVVFVPEAATLLLNSGEYPTPEEAGGWTQKWQDGFQKAIIKKQLELEEKYENHPGIVVFDRGLLDGAAYLPGGIKEFENKFGVNAQDILSRYDKVIHLVSLAKRNPKLYGKTGNEQRFESIEEAKKLEQNIENVWKGHPNRTIINEDIGGLVNRVISEVERKKISRKIKMNKQTIKKLAKLANDLDKRGLYKEANEIDDLFSGISEPRGNPKEWGDAKWIINVLSHFTKNYTDSHNMADFQEILEDYKKDPERMKKEYYDAFEAADNVSMYGISALPYAIEAYDKHTWDLMSGTIENIKKDNRGMKEKLNQAFGILGN